MDNENFYERLGSYFVSEDESQTANYVNNNINSKLFDLLIIFNCCIFHIVDFIRKKVLFYGKVDC